MANIYLIIFILLRVIVISNNNEQKSEQLFLKLEAVEKQVQMLMDTVSKLQVDCQWYRNKITQLENQLAGCQRRGPEKHSGGSGKCDGLGYLRSGGHRERCTIRGEMACTSCGECGKRIK